MASASRPLPYEVTVLRLGHRLVRDARMSTHLGLVARAFGAQALILSGADDETVDSLRKVSEQWGGDFRISYAKNWRAIVKSFRGTIVHLTMYGEPLETSLPKIREDSSKQNKLGGKKLLLVIGAEKVPREMYELAHFNVAIGDQPHSEIAALAVFLDRLFMGEELYYKFDNARLRILPSTKGKRVVNLS